ncbi:MAG: hypothetical protein EBT06_11930 [Gammaproteobacteria bacterium]|nr:hypothetical protein [Gammaproteobacteria bacterium]
MLDIVIKSPRSEPGSGKLPVAVRSKNSTRAWVIFQSAHWVNFPSAPTPFYWGILTRPQMGDFKVAAGVHVDSEGHGGSEYPLI